MKKQAVAVFGLLVFFGLGLQTAVFTTPTVDESVHILRGQSLWQTGDLRFQSKHTPLPHWLNGTLLLIEPTLPDVTTLPSWNTSDDRPQLATELLWQYAPQPNIERIFLLARLPILWLGLLLGAAMGRWAWAWNGLKGEAIAMLFFALSPNLLAHFSLATTDGAATAVFFLAIFFHWRYISQPTKRRWLLASIFLGLGLGGKLTAVLLLPITLILSYTTWRRGQNWWQPLARWLALLPIAAFMLWALYGFELRPLTTNGLPLPAASYLAGFLELSADSGTRYHMYLLGDVSTDGWYHYFIVTFLLKTPLPTLILLITAVLSLWATQQVAPTNDQTVRATRWVAPITLLLPAAILFAIASYSRINIGYRHILPMLPFLLLFIAITIPRLMGYTILKWGMALLLGWYVFTGLRQQPHNLAYFNEIAGGSTGGSRYLADSNIDWGQSLAFLPDEIDRLSYFGSADPIYYGIDLPPLFDGKTGEPLDFARANPTTGRYAIRVNHLLGHVLPEPTTFDWFTRQEPIANAGHSILIYDVAKPATGSWVAHCLAPAPLLDEQTAVSLINQTAVRHLYFDCQTSWPFPADGAAGWYILPQQDAWPMAELAGDHLSLVYQHNATTLEPSYAVWYWDGQVAMSDLFPSPVPPEPMGETAVLATTHPSPPHSWWTIWQFTDTPAAPLTIAAHLYSDAPTPIATGDGLGFTSDQWQAGDWLVQMHTFEEEINGRFLKTGLYNYLTGEPLADFITIPSPK